jgi:hypothetical protein
MAAISDSALVDIKVSPVGITVSTFAKPVPMTTVFSLILSRCLSCSSSQGVFSESAYQSVPRGL